MTRVKKTKETMAKDFLSAWGIALLLLFVSLSATQPTCDPECRNNGVCQSIFQDGVLQNVCNCTGTGFTGSYCQTREETGDGNLTVILVSASIGGVFVIACVCFCIYGTVRYKRDPSSSRSRTTGRDDGTSGRDGISGRDGVSGRDDRELVAIESQDANESEYSPVVTSVPDYEPKKEENEKLSTPKRSPSVSSQPGEETKEDKQESPTDVVIEVADSPLNQIQEDTKTSPHPNEPLTTQDNPSTIQDDPSIIPPTDLPTNIVETTNETEGWTKTDISTLEPGTRTTDIIKEAWDKIESYVDADSILISSDESFTKDSPDVINPTTDFVDLPTDCITDAESMKTKPTEDSQLEDVPLTDTSAPPTSKEPETTDAPSDSQATGGDTEGQEELYSEGIKSGKEPQEDNETEEDEKELNFKITDDKKDKPARPPMRRLGTITRGDVKGLKQRWETIASVQNNK